VVRSMRSADAEFIRGFQGCAADAANDRRAIAAGERVRHFAGAMRAVKERRLGLR
jgi:hypothetical protein